MSATPGSRWTHYHTKQRQTHGRYFTYSSTLVPSKFGELLLLLECRPLNGTTGAITAGIKVPLPVFDAVFPPVIKFNEAPLWLRFWIKFGPPWFTCTMVTLFPLLTILLRLLVVFRLIELCNGWDWDDGSWDLSLLLVLDVNTAPLITRGFSSKIWSRDVPATVRRA